MGSLARKSETGVCKACRRDSNLGVYPGLCTRCEAVILAAGVLLEGGYDREDEIVATLAFAAYAAEDTRIGEFRDSLEGCERGSERERRLRTRFSAIFKLLHVWDVSEGVPIMRRDPIQIHHDYAPVGSPFEAHERTGEEAVEAYERACEHAGRVCIDILDVSVKPEKVASRYCEALEEFELEVGSSDEGGIGWQAVSGIIHMTVHPGLVDPSLDALLRHLERKSVGELERLLFPASELVGDTYAVLRGSKAKGKFRGVGFELAGRKTQQPEAKTVVPACAAWFLAGERASPEHETKARVTRIVNKQLCRLNGLKEVYNGTGEFNQLWRDVRKHETALRLLKQYMAERLQQVEIIDGYFSARVS